MTNPDSQIRTLIPRGLTVCRGAVDLMLVLALGVT